MEQPEPAELRRHIGELTTRELLEALARREREEEWLPEAYAAMDEVLRERGVAVEDAVAAAREELPHPDAPLDLVVVSRSFNPVDAQLVRARLEQAVNEAAITVPQQAVVRGAEGASVLVVGSDNKVASVPVKTGGAQNGSSHPNPS